MATKTVHKGADELKEEKEKATEVIQWLCKVEARAGVEPTYTDLQTRGLHLSAISIQKDSSRWPPAALKPSSTPEFFTIETVLKCWSEECWTAMKSLRG